MLYAEHESYRFLSISLSANVRENPMTASESSAEGGGVKCHCVHWPRTKCREQIKMRRSVTVIPNNRMENVSPNEECQPRFAVFFLSQPSSAPLTYW